MQLDQWQQDILDHRGHLLLCTGRQVGKTTIFARKAAERMLSKPNQRIIIVSLTEDQAQLMIAMILNYLDQNHKSKVQKGKKRPTKSVIHLKNKSMVIARPVGNTGDAVRGFTGNVLIVDEGSRMPEMMWKAAKPTLLTTGGEIWMCSTPHGKQGYFYECYLNKHKRFKVVHVNSVQVMNERKISDSWTKEQKEESIRFLEEEKKDMSELEFAQEYLGMFIDDLQQLFPDELTRKCMTAQRRENIAKRRDTYLGVDIARLGKDETSYEILERNQNNHLIHLENQTTTKTILTQTAAHIFQLNDQYDFRKIYPDSEGLGVGVLDMLLSDERTKRKTEGLKNSQKIIDYKNQKKTKLLKQDLYMNLLTLMEKGQIRLLDDDSVFQSFKSVQYEFITDKKGQPFMRIFGNYTHIVEGLIRAAWCVKDKSLKVWIDYF